ncbi:hypothetical protein FKM82_019235 [Ascaphus truei]
MIFCVGSARRCGVIDLAGLAWLSFDPLASTWEVGLSLSNSGLKTSRYNPWELTKKYTQISRFNWLSLNKSHPKTGFFSFFGQSTISFSSKPRSVGQGSVLFKLIPVLIRSNEDIGGVFACANSC